MYLERALLLTYPRFCCGQFLSCNITVQNVGFHPAFPISSYNTILIEPNSYRTKGKINFLMEIK